MIGSKAQRSKLKAQSSWLKAHGSKPIEKTFREARPQILSGDLVLFRRRGVIAACGRGVHSHAGKAVWIRGRLYLVDVKEWCGGRVVVFQREFERRRLVWDIYEADPEHRWSEYKRWQSIDKLMDLAGCRYGWLSLFLAGLRHLPVARLFCRPLLTNGDVPKRPPFCSEAVAWAERVGGKVDVVPNLADRLTEPADLARSAFYRYRFTIVPKSS